MEIVSYTTFYKEDFVKLNIEWLEKYFVVEPYDEELFQHPEKIIENGGQIFLAKSEEKIVGTIALMKEPEGFELAKLAVTESCKGKGIGNLLMVFCLDFARKNNIKKVFLISNRGLLPALKLYEKFGFIEVPMNENNPYARGNIRMEIIL